MNWKNAFFVLLVIFIATLAWAIKLNNEKTADKGTIREHLHCPPDPSQKMPFKEAFCRMDAYLDYADHNIPANNYQGLINCSSANEFLPSEGTLPAANKVVRMFHITHPCELATMLSFADNQDSIYTLLSLQPDTSAGHSGEVMLDLIFAAYNGTDNSEFYDFTTPCPPMCGTGGNQQ